MTFYIDIASSRGIQVFTTSAVHDKHSNLGECTMDSGQIQDAGTF